MVQDKSIGGRIFDAVNYSLLFIIALVTFLPFIHVIAGSFTTVGELARKADSCSFRRIWSLDAYKLHLFNEYDL